LEALVLPLAELAAKHTVPVSMSNNAASNEKYLLIQLPPYTRYK
jgi:hypothetical protein